MRGGASIIMKKIIVYGLATCCGVCNAFAAEDSLLNPKAVAEVLGKYSAQINQNFQTKIMSNCVSGYLNQDVLDLEHFLHCCKSTIGRDFTNIPTCNKMGQDMRAAHNNIKRQMQIIFLKLVKHVTRFLINNKLVFYVQTELT